MIKVFEAFTGIGTQRMALRNIGVEHEVVAISEIDKYAIASYEAIHGPVNNLGDISKVKSEDIPDHDLFTYSFPCTDISIAGKKEGFTKGSGTRSSLLWECERIIRDKKPKYLLMENVKALIFKNNIRGYQEWLSLLEDLGYKNFSFVLNSKDYDIPQNRERVFCVSILDYEGDYKPSEPLKKRKKIRDILEKNPGKESILSDFIVSRFKYNPNFNNEIKKLGTTAPLFRKYGQRDIVYSPDGIAPTLMASDYKQPKQIGVRVGDFYNIRKLTPLECWRLMGIKDEDFYKAKEVSSNTQLYKQAGNAIVVQVLEAIFKTLLKEGCVD